MIMEEMEGGGEVEQVMVNCEPGTGTRSKRRN
jgi:hypothetical protein